MIKSGGGSFWGWGPDSLDPKMDKRTFSSNRVTGRDIGQISKTIIIIKSCLPAGSRLEKVDPSPFQKFSRLLLLVLIGLQHTFDGLHTIVGNEIHDSTSFG